MKKIKFLAFAAIAIISMSSVLYLNSCKKDPCKDVVCNNGGTCVEGTCSCTTGYEGTNCETESRAKFIGTWKAADNGSTSGAHNYNCVISNASSATTDVLLTNFAAAGTSAIFHGSVSGTKITFNNETVAGLTISNGSGTINSAGNSISVSFSINDGTGAETETGTWTKQ